MASESGAIVCLHPAYHVLLLLLQLFSGMPALSSPSALCVKLPSCVWNWEVVKRQLFDSFLGLPVSAHLLSVTTRIINVSNKSTLSTYQPTNQLWLQAAGAGTPCCATAAR